MELLEAKVKKEFCNSSQSRASVAEALIFCAHLQFRSWVGFEALIVARRRALRAHGLRRQGRGVEERGRAEVKELQHVVLRGITLGQWRQIEAGFDEFENRGAIPRHVRNKVRLDP